MEKEILNTIYDGWHTYQTLLIDALRPLQSEQLALAATGNLRTVDVIARHIIGARARWFHLLMGEGGERFAELGTWDRPGMPARSAAELIEGLEETWQGMHAAIAAWTPEQWQVTYLDDEDPRTITRPWVIWHLIEHDVHHGGEISLTLGMHGLTAPDL